MTRVGKDVEKFNPAHITGDSGKWYSHFEKSFEKSWIIPRRA